MSAWSMLILTKPGIAAGVAVAGLAGMSLAAGSVPEGFPALVCLLCILMAAAGSAALNVALEADADALMPRVAGRRKALLNAGKGATAFVSVLLILSSLAVSFFYLNTLTALLILAAVLSYLLLYTLYLKRRSPYGTVLGGIPGALPVLIGYASVNPGLGADGIILSLVMLLWQPPHFLALALKHKGEYEAAGIPVMPVAYGEAYTKYFMFVYAVALPPMTLSLWVLGYCSAFFAALTFLAGMAFLAACYVDVVRTRHYGRAFAASIIYIMVLLVGVVVDVGVRGPVIGLFRY